MEGNALGRPASLEVVIDERSGFCFGVVNAIAKAEVALASGDPIYSLGDIVHNLPEMRRLESLGLRTIDHGEIEALRGATLLVRAHGEPPSTFEAARRAGVRVVDATCPVVARLQKLVIEAHDRMRAAGGQVVILGKKGHAEVVGLTGQVDDPTIVIESLDEADRIDYGRPVFLLSQTTQSLVLFEALRERILSRAADPRQVVVRDTICRQVSSREEHLRRFAGEFDTVIFVGGRKSSNGKVLFEVCRSAGRPCHHIEDESELLAEWFDGCRSVGVCGATSTPKWLMARVAGKIKAMAPR